MAEENGQKTRKPTYDHLKKMKQPSVRRVRIITDAEVDDEFRSAQAEWGVAQLIHEREDQDPRQDADYRKAKTRYDKALKAAEDVAIEFKFVSVGRKRFRELLDAHSPTADQIAKAEDKGEESPDWNTDTFPQAIVQAACVSPELTLEDVQEMWDSDAWSEAELNDLFTAAVQVQNTRRLLEVGNA